MRGAYFLAPRAPTSARTRDLHGIDLMAVRMSPARLQRPCAVPMVSTCRCGVSIPIIPASDCPATVLVRY